jgi:transposase
LNICCSRRCSRISKSGGYSKGRGKQRTNSTHILATIRTLNTQGYHEVLQAARQRQRTGEFQAQYAQRAGIEGTLSQGVRAFDLRRSRYIGLAKTHLQHILIATAINLVRIVAWLTEPHPQKRSAAPLAALAFAA